MNIFERTKLIAHIARWRWNWERFDTAYAPDRELPPSFKSAREAAALIPDEACVISCGIAGNARCSILFRAIREHFEQTGGPRGLTWISVAGQGGRGRVPGTVEEVARSGLVTRYITGHVETAKAMLHLADCNKLELHVLPQGEMTHIIEAQGYGRNVVKSATGVGSFLDPRVGRGSPVTPRADLQLIEAGAHPDELIYTLPHIDVALFNAPYADHNGNIYFHHAATITENIEAARAARHNGGLVCACVSGLIERDDKLISLPAKDVDMIVINPDNEQTGSVPQKRYWPMFVPGTDQGNKDAVRRLRFINETLRITPYRGPVDQALARLGATTFVNHVSPGATVNIGVGLAEEVCRVLCSSGVHKNITFTTESGVYGGTPASGIFFGAAVQPMRLESSAWMFHHYAECLDAAMLGFLELDSAGNINLSNRGERLTDYVGPGGAPSIIEAAQTVFFIGKWMQGARVVCNGERLQVKKAGMPKLVQQVHEVSFNGRVNLARGKQIFYVTDLAVLQLYEAGLKLLAVMPGIDIERDLLANAQADIIVPDNPPPMTVPAAVVTGRDFHLAWPHS
ncbi:MAG: hypothetical protein HKN70_02020 [Gammaproteobacteria bacterium]|nr:hypothetical protein [Gammaproteobacteria bacterium]